MLPAMCESCQLVIVERRGYEVDIRMPDGSVKTFRPGRYPNECKSKGPDNCTYRALRERR